MSTRLKFIGLGLLVATFGEVVNNFIVGIEGVSAVGNFLFAMVFYAVILSVAYRVQQDWQHVSKRRVLTYITLFGVGIGLIVNEWLLVGNHPLNPNAAHLITQLAMVAYHTLLYTIPLLFIHRPLFWSDIKRWGVRAIGVIVLASVVALTLDPELRLAVALFCTYFIAYLGMFIYVIQKVIRE